MQIWCRCGVHFLLQFVDFAQINIFLGTQMDPLIKLGLRSGDILFPIQQQDLYVDLNKYLDYHVCTFTTYI